MKDIIKDLLQDERPEEFKDFLFEIQNHLIEYGYVQGFTSESRQEFASRFIRLQEFFSHLEKRYHIVED